MINRVMIGWRVLCVFCMYVVGEEIGTSPIYSMIPSTSPLFDQSLLEMPRTRGVDVGSRQGQLLSFAPGTNFGGAQMSPLFLRPPGNVQYANACDPSAKEEMFKKCLADQLGKLKNVMENCRKMFGENAKECCISEECLNSINGGNRSCDEKGESKGCEKSMEERLCDGKKCREKLANEILKNIDMNELMKSLVEPITKSLKKMGDKLGNLASCAIGMKEEVVESGSSKENTTTVQASGAVVQDTAPKPVDGNKAIQETTMNVAQPRTTDATILPRMGAANERMLLPGGNSLPSGILIYPADIGKYETIANVLGKQLGKIGEGRRLERSEGPERMCSNGLENVNGRCLDSRGSLEDAFGMEKDTNRGAMERKRDRCDKRMCRGDEHRERERLSKECRRYCKNMGGNVESDRDTPEGDREELSEETEDSSYYEKR